MKFYKKSRYTFYYKINEKIGAFYNSLNIGVIFGLNKFLRKILEIRNNIEPNSVGLTKSETLSLQKLISEGFIVEENDNEKKKYDMIRQKSIKPTELIAMYIILTENCNFRCRYCAFFAHLPKDYESQLMTKEMVDKALDLFLKHCSIDQNKRKSIVLYGGEPLLNIPIFKYIVRKVRSKTFGKKCGGNIEIITFTNGSLVNPDIAKFCGMNKIIPIVSLDGPKQVHDLMRKDINKKGTFEKVLKGYFLLKKYGCNVGISTTVASHNVDDLPSIIRYFKNELEPINVGLNPLHLITDPKKEPWAITLEKSAYGMLEAFETARKLGVYVEQIMRRIRPFVERTPRVKDCPSCGGLIRFYPSGKYGPCGHFVSMGKNCLSINEDTSWVKSELRKKWSQRSSFNMGEKCKFCPAVSMCGGGCPLSAYKVYGDIMSIDNRMCVQSKIFLEWLIKDLYKIIKPNFQEKILIYKPSQKEREKIYGKINIFDKKLPLQEYSRFGEIYE
jgi:uncharacterized protein